MNNYSVNFITVPYRAVLYCTVPLKNILPILTISFSPNGELPVYVIPYHREREFFSQREHTLKDTSTGTVQYQTEYTL